MFLRQQVNVSKIIAILGYQYPLNKGGAPDFNGCNLSISESRYSYNMHKGQVLIALAGKKTKTNSAHGPKCKDEPVYKNETNFFRSFRALLNSLGFLQKLLFNSEGI